MILLDTSILSTFARVERLDLLFALFGTEDLSVAPAVYAELVAGRREGRPFLQAAIDLIEDGTLTLVPLTAEEIIQRHTLPPALSAGEAESIALCRSR